MEEDEIEVPEFFGFSHDPFDPNYAPDEYHTSPRDTLYEQSNQ